LRATVRKRKRNERAAVEEGRSAAQERSAGAGTGTVLRIQITCFWASRIRILSSEVWIRIRIGILLSSCKNSKKNLDSYYFVTLFDFLSLKMM
jgi:hypothetical protein